jgi:hypothetical protein
MMHEKYLLLMNYLHLNLIWKIFEKIVFIKNKDFFIKYRFRCEWLSSDSDLFRFRSSVDDKAGLALGELGWVDDGVVKPIVDSLSPWFEFVVDIVVRSDLIER